MQYSWLRKKPAVPRALKKKRINIPCKHRADVAWLTRNVSSLINQSTLTTQAISASYLLLGKKELLKKVRESGNNVRLLDLIITFFMSFFIPPLSFGLSSFRTLSQYSIHLSAPLRRAHYARVMDAPSEPSLYFVLRACSLPPHTTFSSLIPSFYSPSFSPCVASHHVICLPALLPALLASSLLV